MPRNPGKNVYVTIAFARTSPILEMLQREATEMSISIADVIKVLLAERVEAPQRQDKQQDLSGKDTPIQPLLTLPDEKISQTVTDEASKRAASAASAASYWDD